MDLNGFSRDFSKRMFFFYKRLVFEKKEFIISKRILEESSLCFLNIRNSSYVTALQNLTQLEFWLCLLKIQKIYEASYFADYFFRIEQMQSIVKKLC